MARPPVAPAWRRTSVAHRSTNREAREQKGGVAACVNPIAGMLPDQRRLSVWRARTRGTTASGVTTIGKSHSVYTRAVMVAWWFIRRDVLVALPFIVLGVTVLGMRPEAQAGLAQTERASTASQD